MIATPRPGPGGPCGQQCCGSPGKGSPGPTVLRGRLVRVSGASRSPASSVGRGVCRPRGLGSDLDAAPPPPRPAGRPPRRGPRRPAAHAAARPVRAGARARPGARASSAGSASGSRTGSGHGEGRERRRLRRRAVPLAGQPGRRAVIGGTPRATTRGRPTRWSGRCSRWSTPHAGEPWCRALSLHLGHGPGPARRSSCGAGGATPSPAGWPACSRRTPCSARPCSPTGRPAATTDGAGRRPRPRPALAARALAPAGRRGRRALAGRAARAQVLADLRDRPGGARPARRGSRCSATPGSR